LCCKAIKREKVSGTVGFADSTRLFKLSKYILSFLRKSKEGQDMRQHKKKLKAKELHILYFKILKLYQTNG
jgi:hypothetical protein